MEDLYRTPEAKMSLVFAAMKQALEYSVAEFGVGESIALSLFGWRDDRLIGVAQLDVGFDEVHSTQNHVRRTAEAAVVLRRGWGVDALTLAAEGYVSNDAEFSGGLALSEAFVRDDGSRVSECLSVIHVSGSGWNICASPYSTRGRRNIVWGDVLVTDDPSHVRDNDFLKALGYSLGLEVWEQPSDVDTFFLALSMGLEQSAGFFLNYDM